MPKSRKLRQKKSKPVKSKQVKNKIMKSSKKSKYMNDPIGHRKSLHGKSFTDCYDKFKKLKNTKSHKEAVKYLKTHLPKCIDIIGDYLLEH